MIKQVEKVQLFINKYQVKRYSTIICCLVILTIPFLYCKKSEVKLDPKSAINSINSRYVIFAWNDLGMHCLNPSYNHAIILPPYNTIWVQVVQRGIKPKIITGGLTVEYRIIENTKSYGKRLFGQFWDNSKKVFGISLPRDRGLNLEDPDTHNGLTGTMAVKGDHFQANGIPLTPIDDSDQWNPYQVAEITVKDSSTGAIIGKTRCTVPTSDEINCAKCHGSSALIDVLKKHNENEKTNLSLTEPVLCASCHKSPALGNTKSPQTYLSKAIHGYHADKGAECKDCHPGVKTQCNRSLKHTAPDGNCVACHGDMSKVASSINAGRIPWVQEPTCVSCHGTGVAQVDTLKTLYRNAVGHGKVYCASCHGSPHAMVPSREKSDNYQAENYQGSHYAIGSCHSCHDMSKEARPALQFNKAHSSGSNKSACNICHTSFTSNVNDTNFWPHKFQWKKR